MPNQLLSQRDIAKHIGKAFSTVSGYVDQFPEFFSHNGEDGLTRRYHPESLAVASLISELKSQRLPVDQIRQSLTARFGSGQDELSIERRERPVEPSIEPSIERSTETSLGDLPPDPAILLSEAELLVEEPALALAATAPALPAADDLSGDLSPARAEADRPESAPERSIERSMEKLAVASIPETPAEDARLTELAQLVSQQQGKIAMLEEQMRSILDIQAAIIRERDQYHADLAADLLERDKLMVKWVRELHAQPGQGGGWLRRLWLLSPLGRPKA